MELGLEGRAVLVTGASAGIGRAIAVAFARERARVAVMARRAELLAELCAELRERHGAPQAVPIAGDVGRAEDLKRAVELARAELGALDVAVSNAGGPPPGAFLECTDAMWQQGFERNFLALVRLARLVIPIMRGRRWGRIVHVSSVAAREPIARLVISSALRAGLLGLVRAIAREHAADGIGISCVLPGYTATERLAELAADLASRRGVSPEAIRAGWCAEIPAGRLGTPEEIADAVLFLASERAGYVNGIGLAVDGGLLRSIG
ncbi:MAG: oxidoreductase [Planctomycetota bacterium]|nr:MAG: oxidoreductase [Planctomycetota bacterium]